MKEFTERQQDILNVSIELISEKGIQQLTIKNISKKLGRTEGAIYRHFDSKTDILVGILNRFKKYNISTQKQMENQDNSPVAKLENLFTQHFEQFAANPAMAAVIFSEEIFQNEKQLADHVFTIMQGTLDHVAGIIDEGQKRGQMRDDVPPDQLTMLVIGALRLLVTRWRLSRHAFDLQEQGAQLCKTVEQILRK